MVLTFWIYWYKFPAKISEFPEQFNNTHYWLKTSKYEHHPKSPEMGNHLCHSVCFFPNKFCRYISLQRMPSSNTRSTYRMPSKYHLGIPNRLWSWLHHNPGSYIIPSRQQHQLYDSRDAWNLRRATQRHSISTIDHPRTDLNPKCTREQHSDSVLGSRQRQRQIHRQCIHLRSHRSTNTWSEFDWLWTYRVSSATWYAIWLHQLPCLQHWFQERGDGVQCRSFTGSERQQSKCRLLLLRLLQLSRYCTWDHMMHERQALINTQGLCRQAWKCLFLPQHYCRPNWLPLW